MNKNSYKNFCVVILAAGEGVRMCSKLPKVLHMLSGKTLIDRVIQSASNINPLGLVLGKGKERIIKHLKINHPMHSVHIIHQKQQRGSGDALLSAQSFLKHSGKRNCLVLCGDVPLITPETLKTFIEYHNMIKAHATVLSAIHPNPYGYGRIVRDTNDEFTHIIEELDASASEKNIKEINTGIYCFDITYVLNALSQIKPDNAKHELYLTDVLTIVHRASGKISAYCISDYEETLGINNRIQLAEAERIINTRTLHRLMKSGVTITDPAHTYINPEAIIGTDTRILPGVIITGKTRIGNSCTIGPYAVLRDTVVEDHVVIVFSYVMDSVIKKDSTIGPFSNIKPGSVVRPKD